VAKRPLPPDAFEPRADTGHSFATLKTMAGVVLVPITAALLFFGSARGEVPWQLWVVLAITFIAAVHALITET
jgi:hypothetical protein